MRVDAAGWRAAGGDGEHYARVGEVGPVAGFVDGDDRILAGLHPLRPEVGTLSDWLGGDGVRLEAEAWLAAQGCRVARGPLAVSAWLGARASLGPFEDAPFTDEPTAPDAPWREAGYRELARWLVATVPHEGAIAAGWAAAERLSGHGWRLEPLADRPDGRAKAEDIERLAADLIALGACDPDATDLLPVPAHVLQAHLERRRPSIDPRLCLRVLGPDGTLAGTLFALPDSARPERRWFLATPLLVHPESRKRGVGAWLLGAAHRTAQRLGYTAGVHLAPDTERYRSAVARSRGRVIRAHALFERPLSPHANPDLPRSPA